MLRRLPRQASRSFAPVPQRVGELAAGEVSIRDLVPHSFAAPISHKGHRAERLRASRGEVHEAHAPTREPLRASHCGCGIADDHPVEWSITGVL